MDKRGSSTKDLHKKAKEYQVGNPDTPYKNCLRIVGKELTKKVTETIV